MIDPATVLAAGGWCAGWVLLAGVRALPRGSAGAPAPSISVIVPARDEAQRLPRLLEALAAGPSPVELIVVDDGSVDDTAALARAAGATVVAVTPAPGWTGKTWACQQGASGAGGDVLVFLDADTEPEPGFVDDLAARAASTGGLVSVQPWHRVERAYEHLSAFANVVAVLGAGCGPAPRRRWWRRPMAFGPAMAIPRAAYLAAGGHGAVRAEVAEDVALATHLDARGTPVEAWSGGGIAYRMYPEGPRPLVEGWSKNLAAGAGATAPLRAGAVALWITALLSVVGGAAGGGLALLALLAGGAQALVLLRRVGRFGVLDAVLYPVLLAGFVGLFTLSAGQRLLGRPARWRGREIPVQ